MQSTISAQPFIDMNTQTEALIHCQTFLRALQAQANTRRRWQAEEPAAAECLRIVEEALAPEAPTVPVAAFPHGRWTPLPKIAPLPPL